MDPGKQIKELLNAITSAKLKSETPSNTRHLRTYTFTARWMACTKTEAFF